MATDNEKKVPENQEQPEQRQRALRPQDDPNHEDFMRFAIFRSVSLHKVEGYILRQVGQAYMIMPTGPRMKDYQGMITLNETGAFLYKELDKPEPTKDKLIQACKDEYGASDEEALEAVDAFVNQCANCGLLPLEEHIFDKEQQKEITKDEYIAIQTGKPEESN